MIIYRYRERNTTNKKTHKRKEENKMTMVICMAGILVGCAYESITEYYGFNLEKKIREFEMKRH